MGDTIAGHATASVMRSSVNGLQPILANHTSQVDERGLISYLGDSQSGPNMSFLSSAFTVG